LRALEDNGFAVSTLVVFTSDNGPERYAYERTRKFGHRSFGPLRGVKRDLWEGGHRVPFLVRWPGVVQPGTVTDALISQIDLMATLAAIVGAPLPNGTARDSYDLLRVWKEGAPSPRRTIVHNTMAHAYAVRHDEWLLVAARTGAVSPVPDWYDADHGYVKNTHAGELYDLNRDFGQKQNLFAAHPQIVQELQSLLRHIQANGQVR
jgi:arylsulfatase A